MNDINQSALNKLTAEKSTNTDITKQITIANAENF
jgi:hypothetical protein